MVDDKHVEAEVVQEEAKQEDKSATARKKSLGGLDEGVVLSGPRQRKKADQYTVEVKEKADFVIKAGKGTKLGEIPNVHYLLGKLKTDDELLTSLHTLVFKRPGTAHRRKKNLYEFSGLTLDEGDKDKEMEKLQERLSKWTIPLLNGALDVFELPRGNGDEGKKEAKVERLLKFLEEPKKLSEKDLAAQAAKKKDAAKAKKEKEQKSKTPKSAAKGGRKSEGAQESTKKKRAKKAESGEAEDEPSEEEEEEEEEEEKAEPEEQPKKRAKKEDAGSAKKATEKKTPASRKSASKKRKADEEEAQDGPSGEAAEGALAEGAGEAGGSNELPDDETIKEATLELLKVSDVNTTTVKDLLAKLNEQFGTDLTKKKPLIKRIAVDYAQSKAAASEEAGAQDAAAAKAEAVAEDAPPPAKKQNKEEGDKAEAAVEDTAEAAKAAGSAEEAKAEEAKAESAEEAKAAETKTEEAKAEPMEEAEAAEAKAEPAEEAKAEPEAMEATTEAETKGEAGEGEGKEAADDAMETDGAKSEAASKD
ncbi:hypothetical protein PLESTM_001681000 [Pleodorina starrii]|nr:hypothetical protein PLESTM_001681000 [Pleodorina starrii]